MALAYDRFVRRADGAFPDTVLLCGGGASNPVLREHLDAALAEQAPAVRVLTVDERGWPRQTVEAAAFALLAHYRLSGWPANLPEPTGARHPVLLGQITGMLGRRISAVKAPRLPPRKMLPGDLNPGLSGHA